MRSSSYWMGSPASGTPSRTTTWRLRAVAQHSSRLGAVPRSLGMRRLLVGVVWFVVLWISGLVSEGAVGGAIANATQARPGSQRREGHAYGESAGRAAGSRFG